MVLRKQSVIAANGRRSKLEKYDKCGNDERVGEHDRRNVLVIHRISEQQNSEALCVPPKSGCERLQNSRQECGCSRCHSGS
eukprot:CAMPEP_0185323158 /NCGR_PEP_ID=MMETSP1363-20130426/61136_1 /TAXON_ID=38817 /ORGANISM="Gephyrocapsa oceanica, Strain RCC1303" /LENGTH=80 /DNA_ID=CAMNT_0027921727 /DNA_START=225 /DNA_END=465 /DNA_ORIENTATION=-